jgi:hypothetical protein
MFINDSFLRFQYHLDREIVSSNSKWEMARDAILKKGIDQMPDSVLQQLHIPLEYCQIAIINKVEQVIDTCIENLMKSGLLHETTRGKKLSLLHLAVIANNLDAAKKLIDKGLNINEQDASGWTPLHHATIEANKLMINFLLEKNAKPDIQNSRGGSYSDLLALLHPPTPTDETPIPLYKKSANGQLLQMTYGDFFAATNARYTLENQMSAEFAINDWYENKEPNREGINEGIEKIVHHIYQSRPKSKAKLYLADMLTGDKKTPSGSGLFAGEEIPAWKIVGEYKAKSGRNADSLIYQIGDYLDGLQMRNEFAQTNDGFPNIVPFPIFNEGGFPERTIFLSITPIGIGEQLCWNYGEGHKVKKSSYQELRHKEARDFITTKMDRITTLISGALGKQRNMSNLEALAVSAQFQYIMNTVSVFCSMILEDHISESQGRYLIDINNKFAFSKFMQTNGSTIITKLQETLHLQKELSKNFPQAAAIYKEHVSNLFKKLPYEDAFSYMQNFSASLENLHENLKIHIAKNTIPSAELDRALCCKLEREIL